MMPPASKCRNNYLVVCSKQRSFEKCMALFNYQSLLLFSYQEIGERKMVKNSMTRIIAALFLCSIFLATCALAQDIAPFNPAPLVKLGDEMRYGVYAIRKIGEGIYRLDNSPVHPPIGTPGALGVDFYLICGKTKALMIDSGNNYMEGNNQVPKRMNGARRAARNCRRAGGQGAA